MGRIDRGALLEGLQSLILALAVISLFQRPDLQLSSALVVGWLVLSLARRPEARPWSTALLGLLMLNMRWAVLDEGPTPVSPVDYILMLAAFASGYGQRGVWWLRQASIVALATLVGVLLQLEVVVDFARFGVEYHIAALTKNQTALLAGLACLGGLIGVLAFRAAWLRLLHGLALAAGAVLLRAADSRAGVGMVALAVVAGAAITFTPRLLTPARRRFGPLRRPVLIGAGLVVVLIAGLWLLHQHVPQLAQGSGGGGIGLIYGEENLENDAARLKLWSCYAHLPFTGNNRFIWGVGYERAWRVLCTAREVGRPLSHAHNLLFQVWGENGLFGTVFLLGWLGWIGARVIRNARLPLGPKDSVALFGSSALVVYLLGFNLFELGMVKVPLFLMAFGLFLASPFSLGPGAPPRCGPAAEPPPATLPSA